MKITTIDGAIITSRPGSLLCVSDQGQVFGVVIGTRVWTISKGEHDRLVTLIEGETSSLSSSAAPASDVDRLLDAFDRLAGDVAMLTARLISQSTMTIAEGGESAAPVCQRANEPPQPEGSWLGFLRKHGMDGAPHGRPILGLVAAPRDRPILGLVAGSYLWRPVAWVGKKGWIELLGRAQVEPIAWMEMSPTEVAP